MRMFLSLILLASNCFVGVQATDTPTEERILQSGIVGIICNAEVIEVDGTPTVRLKIPLPSKRRTKTDTYTEPVPNGKERTRTVVYWEHEVQERLIPFSDISVRDLGGERLELAAVKERLKSRSHVIFGYKPSVAARAVLREDTLVMLPKQDVHIEGLKWAPQ